MKKNNIHSYMRNRLKAAILRAEHLSRRLEAILEQQQENFSACVNCGAYDHVTRFCPDLKRPVQVGMQMVYPTPPYYPQPRYCKECGAYDHITSRHAYTEVRRPRA